MVEDIKKMPVGAGLPEMPEEIKLAPKKLAIDYKRIIFILLGLGVFILFYLIPGLPDAVDPGGKSLSCPGRGKWPWASFSWPESGGSLRLCPSASPPLPSACSRYSSTSVRPKMPWAISWTPPSGSFSAPWSSAPHFSASGLTKRMAYKMLNIVGERTNLILLGTFLVTAAMTLIMAHTAVAAALFPLLMAINALYSESDQPTKFGKGLFIGMAWAAGAGSIITFLGAARGVAAAGMFKEFTGNDIGFFELIYYMAPMGLLMVFSIWLIIITFFKPERAVIAGLREKARNLTKELGPMNNKEKFVIFMVIGIVGLFMAKAFLPIKAFTDLDRAGIMLVGTVLFFMTRTLTVEDLETIPWNIILLFGGAMSIGFCLWQTKAAEWLAVHWLSFFLNAPWLVFVLGIAFFVLIMTNFIMNVAAIAIALPVSLVIAKYLGVAPHVILFASLVTAGMPFNLLIGAAPNAIAYESKQFTTGEFFGYGWIPSLVLMAFLTVFVYVIWPLMGMPVLLPK